MSVFGIYPKNVKPRWDVALYGKKRPCSNVDLYSESIDLGAKLKEEKVTNYFIKDGKCTVNSIILSDFGSEEPTVDSKPVARKLVCLSIRYTDI